MFADRHEAGRLLAGLLQTEVDPIVVGIARGGIIVAQAAARAMHAPLDIVVIRKVGHPMQPELALGAVSASGDRVVTPYASEFFHGALEPLFDAQVVRAQTLEAALRGGVRALDVRDKTVILVDDGIATSATMECAVAHARRAGAARVIGAAPVAPEESVSLLEAACDRVAVLVIAHERNFAVGRYYRDFREVDDLAVLSALSNA